MAKTSTLSYPYLKKKKWQKHPLSAVWIRREWNVSWVSPLKPARARESWQVELEQGIYISYNGIKTKKTRMSHLGSEPMKSNLWTPLSTSLESPIISRGFNHLYITKKDHFCPIYTIESLNGAHPFLSQRSAPAVKVSGPKEKVIVAHIWIVYSGCDKLDNSSRKVEQWLEDDWLPVWAM